MILIYLLHKIRFCQGHGHPPPLLLKPQKTTCAIQGAGNAGANMAEFLIKDNVSGGEWDWDILANDWNVEQLNEWGLDLPALKDLNEQDLFDIEIPFYTPSEIKPEINELANFKKTTDEIVTGFSSQPLIANNIAKEKLGEQIRLSDPEKNYINQQMSKADIFLQNAETSFKSMFEQAYKYSDKDTKRELKKLAQDWTNGVGSYRNRDFVQLAKEKPLTTQTEIIQLRSNILDDALVKLDQIYGDPTNRREAPQVFKAVEEFAMEKLRQELDEAEASIKRGEYYTHEEVLEKLGLK